MGSGNNQMVAEIARLGVHVQNGKTWEQREGNKHADT